MMWGGQGGPDPYPRGWTPLPPPKFLLSTPAPKIQNFTPPYPYPSRSTSKWSLRIPGAKGAPGHQQPPCRLYYNNGVEQIIARNPPAGIRSCEVVLTMTLLLRHMSVGTNTTLFEREIWRSVNDWFLCNGDFVFSHRLRIMSWHLRRIFKTIWSVSLYARMSLVAWQTTLDRCCPRENCRVAAAVLVTVLSVWVSSLITVSIGMIVPLLSVEEELL